MNDGLSAGDIMALTKDNDNWQNNPFIYLVWLALLGGGNFFGGRNYDSAMQGAITRSDMFEGFNNQDVNSQLRGLANGLCDGFYAMNTGMLNATAALGSKVDMSRDDIIRSIDANRYEAAKNTCDITTAIHAEGEATRALINANTMQELRDRLDAKNQELQTAMFQLSQQAQNAYLINEIRPCAKPAYITCSPYTSANTGCGCGL